MSRPVLTLLIMKGKVVMANLRRIVARYREMSSPKVSPADVTEATADQAHIENFARAVKTCARKREVQKYHEDRAFIGSIKQIGFPNSSAQTFATDLVAAHRLQLIHLSRADMVAAMDPDLVKQSEIRYMDASFHFVEI